MTKLYGIWMERPEKLDTWVSISSKHVPQPIFHTPHLCVARAQLHASVMAMTELGVTTAELSVKEIGEDGKPA
jgi:hypothetical protein